MAPQKLSPDKKLSPAQERIDQHYMKEALALAATAYREGEVPVGALLVANGAVLGAAYNRVETEKRSLAHAELLALEEGFATQGEKYLRGTTLYVTLEPCPMCAMACSWSQISRIVYGTADPKRGYSLWSPSLLFPRLEVVQGLYAQESRQLLQSFFQALRKK